MNPKHMLVSVAVIAATLTATATATASVVWNGDFETGNLSQYQLGDTQSDLQWCNADDALVYTHASQPTWPTPVAPGTRAVRLKADDTDVSPCTSTANPRSQLGSAPIMANGTAVWESWSMYVPTTFPDVPVSGACPLCVGGNPFYVSQQDFAAPFSGSPPFGFGFSDTGAGDQLDVTLDVPAFPVKKIWTTPLAPLKGTWVKFVVFKRVSTVDAGGAGTQGEFRLKVNGVQQNFACTLGSPECPTSVQQYRHYTMKPGSTEANRFYVSNYRRKGQASTATLYYDRAKVGTTEADVTG